MPSIKVSNDQIIKCILCSLVQSCLTLCNPMNCSTPGFPVFHYLLEVAQILSIEQVMPSNYLIFCHHFLLLPSIFPSIRVFSSESVFRIRWTKHWSFSFSISPSNEYSGLISFRINWFDPLQSKGLSGVFSITAIRKHQFFGIQSYLWSNFHIHTLTTEKIIALTWLIFASKVMCLLFNI